MQMGNFHDFPVESNVSYYKEAVIIVNNYDHDFAVAVTSLQLQFCKLRFTAVLIR